MNLLEAAKAPQPAAEEEDVEFDEANPAYAEARAMLLERLYEAGAGQGLMQALQQAPDIPSALAEQSMLILDMLDQMTENEVPDEYVVPLAVDVMTEVVEIAIAGGIEVSTSDMAAGMRELIKTLITTMGGDATDVAAAMDQVPADELGGVMQSQMGA